MNEFQTALRSYLENATEEIAEAFSSLIQIPTTNPYSGDVNPTGEAKGQTFIEQKMKELGGQTEFVPVPSDVYRRAGILGPRERDWTNRMSLVSRYTFGDGSGPVFILNGHMDTVGVDDCEEDPFSGKRDGDIVHGRGASDCKCGILASLYAIKALQNCGAPLNCQIIQESVVDEECNGSGAGTLSCCLAGIRGDYCLVLDGPASMVYSGCQGVVTAEITVEGRAGHGSAGGVSALEKLLIAKQAIDQLAEERSRVAPECLINVGAIRAGIAPWTVPNHGWLAANINYAYDEAVAAEKAGSGFCGVQVREKLEAFLQAVCESDDWLKEHPAKLEWIKDVPPFRIEDAGQPDREKALLSAATQSYEMVWGKAPKTGGLPAWGDAGHTSRVGLMPTVGLGAGETGTSHTATEYNKVSNVRNTAATAAMTILQLTTP